MGMSTVGAVKGLVLVHHVIPKLSLQISAAALGARWITDSIAELFDPYLTSQGVTPIKDHAGYALLHLGLTAAGAAFQAKNYPCPRFIDKFLLPMEKLEHRLKAFEGISKKVS